MSENQIGISCIIFGMFFFSIQDLLIKTVGLDVSLIQIIVSRAAIGIIFLSIFLYFSGRKIYFGSSYPFIATLRGILFFAGFLLFYIALSEISLAQATSLFFVSPLFMTILSRIILKNPIGIRRIGAIIIGFSGTILIVRPQFDGLNMHMFLVIVCAFTYSLSMILAKLTADKDSLFQQTFHINIGALLLGTFLYLVISIFLNTTQMTILSDLAKPLIFSNFNVLGLILTISLFGSAGLILLIYAYRIGSPLLNSPTEYILLVFAIVNGFLFFREVPDFYSWVGMLLIVGSGFFIILRENVKEALVVSKTTLRT